MAKTRAKQTQRHHAAFLEWYSNDRFVAITCEKLQLAERTLHFWITRYKWHDRADELDKKAVEKAERQAANAKAKRQAEMLKQHFGAGTALLSKGLTYLKDNGVDNGNQAISAVERGVKIQRQAEGLPDWLIELSNMTDDELRDEFIRLQREESEAAEIGNNSEAA